MGSKKNDLEIIYNLQWKNKPANGGDKASIIGVYDIPATTLNWEVFKSYLLKNSGTTGDDVKVSYITDNGKEFPIQSQTDFQVALYAFRRKARLGEMITLKLDRKSDQPHHKNVRHSNDVETQFDDNEAQSLVSICCGSETPPEWFSNYMNQFKKDITEEITAAISSVVSSALANIKPQTVSHPACYHSRKSKESSKRHHHKKWQPLVGDTPADICTGKERPKDLIKSLKLDSKLEKLERKASKYKEKKLALFAAKSSDSDAGHSSSRSRSQGDRDAEGKMDASPVNAQSVVPHMLGGEVYLHQWEVINTGTLPWTSKTFLQFTWGSKALQPLEKVITVPYLQAGEKGIVAVRLQVPITPGQYESYWHFTHRGRRFGHWLGCQIVVDPFDLKGNKSVLETTDVTSFTSTPKKVKTDAEESDKHDAVTHYSAIMLPDPVQEKPHYDYILEPSFTQVDHTLDDPTKPTKLTQLRGVPFTANVLDELIDNVSSRVEDLHLHDPTDTNCSSDSDNQSVVSISGSSNSSKCSRDYVVVPIPDCFSFDKQHLGEKEEDPIDVLLRPSTSSATVNKVEAAENCDDNNNTEDSANVSKSEQDRSDGDMVFISVSSDNKDEGYAYVVVDGQTVPIPKKILKSEFLQKAEQAQKSIKKTPSRNSSNASSVEMINKEEAARPESVQSNADRESVASKTQSNVIEPNNDLSHCSAAGSCFSEVNNGQENNSRLFIFPQSCPGFEVVCPINETPNQNPTELSAKKLWSTGEVPVTSTSFAGPQSTPPLNLSTHDRNPFTCELNHVPNYQQTPPEMRPTPPSSEVLVDYIGQMNIPPENADFIPTAPVETAAPPPIETPMQPQVHILPETLVSGAVNVASSAISTARSVINMIVPREPGRWVNGHWVSASPETPREANLQALAEMGFWNRDMNATLLARYNDDLNRVVAELVQ